MGLEYFEPVSLCLPSHQGQSLSSQLRDKAHLELPWTFLSWLSAICTWSDFKNESNIDANMIEPVSVPVFEGRKSLKVFTVVKF